MLIPEEQKREDNILRNCGRGPRGLKRVIGTVPRTLYYRSTSPTLLKIRVKVINMPILRVPLS